jgi:hypothetical protein
MFCIFFSRFLNFFVLVLLGDIDLGYKYFSFLDSSLSIKESIPLEEIPLLFYSY